VRIAANPTGLPVSNAAAASWRDAQTLDIGIGGAFIVDSDMLIGATLWVELQLPTTEQRFVLPAIVRWVGDRRTTVVEKNLTSDVIVVRGGGVQFVDVDVDVLLELNDYFAEL
jgi:hypothetical protein